MWQFRGQVLFYIIYKGLWCELLEHILLSNEDKRAVGSAQGGEIGNIFKLKF